MKITKAYHLLTQEVGVYHIKVKISISHLNMNYHVLKIIMDQNVTSTANRGMTILDIIPVIKLANVYVFIDGLETIAIVVSHKNTLYFRSSRPEVFLQKNPLKICNKFKHPCRSAISIELLCNLIEIAPRHGCSPVNLLHIFKAPFSRNNSGRLLLYICNFT